MRGTYVSKSNGYRSDWVYRSTLWRELLRQGYEVVGTIRSMEKAEAVREGIAKVTPIDNLTFVEADNQ